MIGQTVVIGCHLVPEEATSGLLSGVSSDEKVAVVDADGAVTGVGYGTVTITATDPMSNISATTSVTVGCLLYTSHARTTSVNLYIKPFRK